MTDDRPTYTILNPLDLQRLATQELHFPIDVTIRRGFDDLEATLYALLPLCAQGLIRVVRHELDAFYVRYNLIDRQGDLGNVGSMTIINEGVNRTVITMHPSAFRMRDVVPEDWNSNANQTAKAPTRHNHPTNPSLSGPFEHAFEHASEWMQDTQPAAPDAATQQKSYTTALHHAETLQRQQYALFERVIRDFFAKLAQEPVLDPNHKLSEQRLGGSYVEARRLVHEQGKNPDEVFAQQFPRMFEEVASDLVVQEQINPASVAGFERIVQVARSRFNLSVGC